MSLQSFLDDYHIEYKTEGHHHCRQGWIQIHCPYCSPKSGWHLGIQEDWKVANCWRCGKHTFWNLLATLTGEYPGKLLTEYHLDKRVDSGLSESIGIKQYCFPPHFANTLTSTTCTYLESRGFDPYHMHHLWGIQSTSHIGDTPHRIYIPIYHKDDLHSHVSYTCRAIGDIQPKYLNAKPDNEIMPIKSTLYGEWAVGRTSPYIIVCEGPTDVWRLGSPAVATYGVNYSLAQVRRMARYSTVVLLYDNDSAGKKEQLKLCSVLRLMGVKVLEIDLVDTKDPGELSNEEAFCLMKEIREKVNGIL
jgi:hypothetical protein